MAEASVGKKTLWAGRIVSAIPVLMLLMSGTFKLVGGAQMAKDWASFGYPPGALVPIGLAEIACAILFAIPRTSILGAVLVTGYLGGAVATHVRASDAMFVAPAILGAVAWLGLYLRDPRLRALLPLRRDP
jgi:DoxX-like family